jgi:hypothetical protein
MSDIVVSGYSEEIFVVEREVLLIGVDLDFMGGGDVFYIAIVRSVI